jgi:hypothetical protein
VCWPQKKIFKKTLKSKPGEDFYIINGLSAGVTVPCRLIHTYFASGGVSNRVLYLAGIKKRTFVKGYPGMGSEPGICSSGFSLFFMALLHFHI